MRSARPGLRTLLSAREALPKARTRSDSVQNWSESGCTSADDPEGRLQHAIYVQVDYSVTCVLQGDHEDRAEPEGGENADAIIIP